MPERLSWRIVTEVLAPPFGSHSQLCVMLAAEVVRLRVIIAEARPTDDSWPRDEAGPADAALAAEARAIREESR